MLKPSDLESILEDIISILEAKRWIKEYQIFMHSIQERSISTKFNNIEKYTVKDASGVHTRILSINNSVQDHYLSIPNINELEQISNSDNRNSVKTILPDNQIKTRISNNSKYISTQDFLNGVRTLNYHDFMKDYNISTNAKVLTEYRFVVNSIGSLAISDHQIFNSEIIINHIDKENTYNSFYQSNISGNFTKLIERTNHSLLELSHDVSNHLVNIKKKMSKDVIGVIFPPKIVSEILLRFLALPEDVQVQFYEPIISNSLLLYENPLLNDGVFSHRFDDQGKKTQPYEVFNQNGQLNKDLINSYKMKSFESFYRFYNFPYKKSYTNIALFGGLGSGEKFTQRGGRFAVVKSGEVVLTGPDHQKSVHLMVHFAEFWERGILTHTVKSFKIMFDLSNFFRQGMFSKDKLPHNSVANTGSIFCGWVWIEEEFIKIIC
jgi:hypothetical protein